MKNALSKSFRGFGFVRWAQKGTVVTMKKLLSVFIAVSFVFSSLTGIAQAETVEAVNAKIERKTQTGGFIPTSEIGARGVKTGGIRLFSGTSAGYDYWEVYNSIELQLRLHEEEVHLWENGYRQVPVEEALRIYRRVLYDNYDIFVLDLGWDFECDSYYYEAEDENEVPTGYIYSIVPGYYTPVEGEAGAIAFINSKINGYLDAASDIPSDDVVGKLLVIEDAICADLHYADEEQEEEKDTGIYDNHLRTVYDALKTGRTVCQGYALVFKTACEALNEQLKAERLGTAAGSANTGGSAGSGSTAHSSGGGSSGGSGGGSTAGGTASGTDDIIETVACSSDCIWHMWDVVKIDGNWYNIDPTWADVDGDIWYNDAAVCARYDFFLRSDDEYIYPIDNQTETHSLAIPTETAGEYEYYTDWVYYTDKDIECTDDKYSSGYIFNRIPDGRITYSDGLYNIDFWGWTFRSEGIVATKVLATDPFLDSTTYTDAANVEHEVPYNAVICLTDFSIEYYDSETYDYVYDTTPYRQIFASYDNGVLTDVSYKEEGNLTYSRVAIRENEPCKMFLWSPDMTEPLCRVIDVPGLESATR